MDPSKKTRVSNLDHMAGSQAAGSGGSLRNTQMYFGGLPLSAGMPSMVVDQMAPIRLQFIKQKRKERPKRFSTDAFLDLYMAEKQKPLLTFAQAERQIEQEKVT